MIDTSEMSSSDTNMPKRLKDSSSDGGKKLALGANEGEDNYFKIKMHAIQCL